MKTILIANQKGGIGKTTTATNMASILTELGYKTLLIDADQQGNSTDTYRAKYEGVATLYDVLIDDEHIPLSEAIQTTENGDIVASDPLLKEGDNKLSSDPEGEYRMLNAIENLQGYDYVIIDSAPSVNWILRNLLIASNEVIIPVTTDRYGLQGLAQLSEVIKIIQKRQNKELKLAGLLIVNYDNRKGNLVRDVHESLKNIAEQMGTKLYETTISSSVRVKEAQALRTTLNKYDAKCRPFIDYKAWIENELLK